MKSFFRMISFCFSFLLISIVNANNPSELEGTVFEMVTDDFENKKSERFYILKEKLSEKISKIEFKNKKPAWLRSGAEVKIKGKKEKKSIVVEEMALNGENAGIEESSLELGVSGVNTTVFIFINSSDGAPYASFDQVSTWMYDPNNSVADLFHKNSRGKFSLNGDRDNNGVLDHHNVNLNISTEGTCPYGTLRSEAIKQLSERGITITDYDHRMYIMPANASCYWAGLASVGGGYSFYASGGSFVYAHELGHNLGLRHSGTDPENDGVANSTYGDHSCPQGNGSGLKFFNAPHSQKLGWTEESQIQDIGQGSYVVSALEDNPTQINHPQIFRINKSDTNEKYFISLRRPNSYTKTLGTNYTTGISIHRWSGSGNTSFIKALAPGESFQDAQNSISISVSSLGEQNSSAVFSVNAQEVCQAANPEMALNPNSINMTESGNYQVQVNVTNKDNSLCPATSFSLNTIFPNMVSGSFSESSFALDPGASKQVLLTLVNSGLAVSDKMVIKLRDIDGDQNLHSETSQELSLIVDTPPPPPVCTMGSPEMTLNPNSINMTDAGNYQVQVSITNKDDLYCDSTTFSLSTVFPSMVSGSFSESSFSLEPGDSKQVILSLVNSGLAASSQMVISLRDVDGDSYQHSSINRQLSLIVDVPPPPISAPENVRVSVRRNGKVTLQWNTTPGAVRYKIYRINQDNVQVTSLTTETQFVEFPSNGTYQYSVSAIDSQNKESDRSSSVTATVSKKQGGGGKGKGKKN